MVSFAIWLVLVISIFKLSSSLRKSSRSFFPEFIESFVSILLFFNSFDKSLNLLSSVAVILPFSFLLFKFSHWSVRLLNSFTACTKLFSSLSFIWVAFWAIVSYFSFFSSTFSAAFSAF